MCITLAKAKLSQTKLYGQETHLNGKTVHVCGYQNRVQNLAGQQRNEGRDWDVQDEQRSLGEDWGWHTPANSPSFPASKGTGNAMILPFPAIPGTMSSKSVISTASCPHILEDMEKAIEEEERLWGRTMKLMSLSVPRDRIEIFEHDIYTVVLAPYGAPIADALADVPVAKRPPLNKSFFDGYMPLYENWTFALCCFNNKDAALAKPLLWQYEPMRPDLLFLPALDCHTGEVPDLKALVQVDHTVVVSSDAMRGHVGVDVSYRETIPDVIRPYIARRVMGKKIHTTLPNGDFVFRLDDVHGGVFNPRRLLPPGARKE